MKISKKQKLKVTKKIKSPYGTFADIGDFVYYEKGLVTHKNTCMALPFHEKYTRKLTPVEKLSELFHGTPIRSLISRTRVADSKTTNHLGENCYKSNPIVIGCSCGYAEATKTKEWDKDLGAYYYFYECEKCNYYWEGPIYCE